MTKYQIGDIVKVKDEYNKFGFGMYGIILTINDTASTMDGIVLNIYWFDELDWVPHGTHEVRKIA